MIVYLDASALVKLYVWEDGSADVDALVRGATSVATSRVAYPEARSALGRRRRESALTPDEHSECVAALDADFASAAVVEVTRELATQAGLLAERHGLKALDSLHLASALDLEARLGVVDRFCSYDGRLRDAARAEGLVHPDE